MRPPYEQFQRPTCKGSYVLGSACDNCERCEWERQHMQDHRPDPPEMKRFGKRIHSWIEDLGGGIICPICHLEMGYFPNDEGLNVLYCGTGIQGDGHWLLADEVFGVLAE